MKFIMNKEIFENVYSKINNIADNSEDGKFTTFRDNHFEVILTKDDRPLDEIRLSTLAISAGVLSGDIDLAVYSTKAALNELSELHKNDKMSLRYIMYNPDASDMFEVFNDEVTLSDIVFEGSYNNPKSNTFTMRFTL